MPPSVPSFYPTRRWLLLISIALLCWLLLWYSTHDGEGEGTDVGVPPVAPRPDGTAGKAPHTGAGGEDDDPPTTPLTQQGGDRPGKRKLTRSPRRDAAATGKRGGVSPPSGIMNGVILFLYGGRWHEEFVGRMLPRLQRYVLSCYPYPTHIFHEGIAHAHRARIVEALPSSPVAFEDVSDVWRSLPNGVTEAKVSQWLTEGVQPKFQGRGYRIMCRFWAGLVWTRPSMDQYEYYWRLDTDSLVTAPVAMDPFRHVFQQRGCEYGYNRLKGENPHVATGIWDSFLRWTEEEEKSAATTEDAAKVKQMKSLVTELATFPPLGNYWAPMYYNNFEMGTFRMKRSAVYQSYFRYVDSHEPFGIFRYRWGDAPLHTLGVWAALWQNTSGWMCNVSSSVVAYRHAVKRPVPMGPAETDRCRVVDVVPA